MPEKHLKTLKTALKIALRLGGTQEFIEEFYKPATSQQHIVLPPDVFN
jgi:hypothetical protein